MYAKILSELFKGDLSWEYDWTFPNSMLFTMTTLTLIG